MFTLLPRGKWAWQEGKRGLKGNVEQLFSIFPEEKEEEIDLQQASRGIYAKYREVFLNVLKNSKCFNTDLLIIHSRRPKPMNNSKYEEQVWVTKKKELIKTKNFCCRWCRATMENSTASFKIWQTTKERYWHTIFPRVVSNASENFFNRSVSSQRVALYSISKDLYPWFAKRFTGKNQFQLVSVFKTQI